MARIRFESNRPERIRRRLREIGEERRFRTGVYVRALALLILNTLGGLLLIALGLNSTSSTWGPTLFWVGVVGANAGFAIILTWSYLRLEE